MVGLFDNAVHGQCTAGVDIASYVSDCRRCDVYIKYKLCGDQDRVSYCYQYRELHPACVMTLELY